MFHHVSNSESSFIDEWTCFLNRLQTKQLTNTFQFITTIPAFCIKQSIPPISGCSCPPTSFKTDPGATKPSETLELREGKPVRSSKVKGSSSCEFSTMEEWRKSRNRPTEIGKRQFGDIPGDFCSRISSNFSVLKRWIPFLNKKTWGGVVFAAKNLRFNIWVFPKIVVFPPKWMVENNGKPY